MVAKAYAVLDASILDQKNTSITRLQCYHVAHIKHGPRLKQAVVSLNTQRSRSGVRQYIKFLKDVAAKEEVQECESLLELIDSWLCAILNQCVSDVVIALCICDLTLLHTYTIMLFFIHLATSKSWFGGECAGTDAFLGKIEGEREGLEAVARPLPFKSRELDCEGEDKCDVECDAFLAMSKKEIDCEGEDECDIFLHLGCEGPGTGGGELGMEVNGNGEQDISDAGLGTTVGPWPLTEQPPRRSQCLRQVLLSQRECAFFLHARVVHISSRVASLNCIGCKTGEAPSTGEPEGLFDPDNHRKKVHAFSPENFLH
jgi:hypothetical protein